MFRIWLLNCYARIRLGIGITNDSHDSSLDPLIYKLARQIDDPFTRVEVDRHRIRVLGRDGELAQFWNENRFYAWCNEGRIGDREWSRYRPSCHAMLTLYLALKKRNQHKLPR